MTLIFLDTETTGLNPQHHQVWEIAYAVGDEPIKSALVHHDPSTADPAALAMNGYWDRVHDLSLYQSFLIEAELRQELKGNTVVAANPAFDTAFLKARWGEAPWHPRLLDLESYALPIFGGEKMQGLAAIAERLGVDNPDHHSAANDVDVLRQCFRKLQEFYSFELVLPQRGAGAA